MNCHTNASRRTPRSSCRVRQAFNENIPVKWARVHHLPADVYLSPKAHVNAAGGCVECHGRNAHMVKVYQAKPLTMEWCVGCHRDPAPHLREPENLTKMGYTPEEGEGERVKTKNNINPPTNCSTCHRWKTPPSCPHKTSTTRRRRA